MFLVLAIFISMALVLPGLLPDWILDIKIRGVLVTLGFQVPPIILFVLTSFFLLHRELNTNDEGGQLNDQRLISTMSAATFLFAGSCWFVLIPVAYWCPDSDRMTYWMAVIAMLLTQCRIYLPLFAMWIFPTINGHWHFSRTSIAALLQDGFGMSVSALFFWMLSSTGQVSDWNSGALRAFTIAAPAEIFYMGYSIVSLTEGGWYRMPPFEWISQFWCVVLGALFGAIHYFVGLGDWWKGFAITLMVHLAIVIPFMISNGRTGRRDRDRDHEVCLLWGEIAINIGWAVYFPLYTVLPVVFALDRKSVV